MHNRCYNPNAKDYRYYGGKGIKVCARWHSFKEFAADMAASWKPGLTIEKNNNNRNYGPGNCRWGTRLEQSRNTSSNHYLVFAGERLLVTDWAMKVGMKRTTLSNRINQLGWSVERALTTPPRRWLDANVNRVPHYA